MVDSYLLALSHADYLSFREKYELYTEFGGADGIYNATFGKLADSRIICAEKIKKLLGSDPRQHKPEMLEAAGIKTCSLTDAEYPERLRNIYSPPVLLYYYGALPGRNCVSVVGSRKTTEIGRLNAYNVSYEIAARGFCIVSGMARGIDSCAHYGALGCGRTAAVLGCGIDICYPPENESLKNMIIKSGCVISEFPPGRKPGRLTFPARNRIISGMSEALIVVEAAEKSGALITADFAMEQGREVYAFDYGNRDVSRGTRVLVNEGAYPVKDVKSFIETVC